MNRTLLKPEQVAAECCLSVKAIYRAIQRGELEAFKICGRWRIDAEAVERWLEQSRFTRLPRQRARRRIAGPPGSLASLRGIDEALR